MDDAMDSDVLRWMQQYNQSVRVQGLWGSVWELIGPIERSVIWNTFAEADRCLRNAKCWQSVYTHTHRNTHLLPVSRSHTHALIYKNVITKAVLARVATVHHTCANIQQCRDAYSCKHTHTQTNTLRIVSANSRWGNIRLRLQKTLSRHDFSQKSCFT